MSDSIRKINKSMLMQRVKIARENAVKHPSYEVIDKLLNYIENNTNHSYYSIVKLLKAADFSELESLMDAVVYLSSRTIKIFSMRFCYYPMDSEDFIEISPESYYEATMHEIVPSDKKGNELPDFDPTRLGFTCFIHSELRSNERS